MVLIADAHVSEARGTIADFSEMLGRLGQSAHDVVFLGDILDLWIALPRYETGLHADFLGWCQAERQRRIVGLVEGNHEFFVADRHADAFSFVSRHEYVDGEGRFFVHGDTVNRTDTAYRLLRAATRNPLTRCLEQIMPRGPAIARRIKRWLNNRRRGMAKTFPEEQVRTFCRRAVSDGAAVVYMGHFHDHRILTDCAGGRCEIVPAWKRRGEVLLIDATDEPGRVVPWREL